MGNQELRELQQAYQEEIEERAHNETVLLNDVAAAEARAAQKIAHEQQLNDQKYVHLARDAEESSHARAEIQRKFQERAVVDMQAVATALAETVKAREQADNDIVAALNHYSTGLQGAVCTVSQGALQAVSK